MLSCLYEGYVTHTRREPAHQLRYPVWYVYLGLDEIEDFCQASRWLSRDSFNLLSFLDQDYLPGEGTLHQRVQARIEQHTGESFDGEIFLLTTLRQLGYAMNPISVFYCFEDGRLVFLVAEVHNTPWNERHVYIVPVDREVPHQHDKAFHVSPFMPMDTTYRWRIGEPGSQLSLGMDVQRDGRGIFNAGLSLTRVPANAASINTMLRRHGWQSLGTVWRIYWQALKLRLKGAPFYPHPRKTQQETPEVLS